LVIETSDFSGGYILGFRADNLEAIFEEVSQLFKTYMTLPFFGVDCVFEEE
jgi:hypothetical protein